MMMIMTMMTMNLTMTLMMTMLELTRDIVTPPIMNIIRHSVILTDIFESFPVEVVNHSPFMMILHELLTEEDMEFLVTWARPRLSRERKITHPEDRGRRPKNEWRTRTTVRP